jgi:hypothetical protein
MLVSILPVPFADATRQRQYDAVEAALHTHGAATVLLGNLGAFTEIEADALVVRPDCIALLVLTPRAGRLTMPTTLAYGTWQLNGQPLPGRDGADNPFAQYRQQHPAALAWLSEQLQVPADALPPCLGVALFDAPLTFGPEVEPSFHQQASTHDFQLVAGAAQLLLRLPQATGASILPEPALLTWAEQVSSTLDADEEPIEAPAENFLEQKLRQLWRWLGAEDIPADPPYGGPALPPSHERDAQEQARLQQLRQELQAELHQQRQEAATREKAREQDLALLRQQLTQAGQSAAERQAEQQAKAALEEALRTARAELAARNHELDTRIKQLGQLIGQLQASSAVPRPTPAPAAPRPAVAPMAAQPTNTAPVARVRPTYRRLRQAERWGLVVLGLAGASGGLWGVMRLTRQPAPKAAVVRPSRRHAPPVMAEEENLSIFSEDEPDNVAVGQTEAAHSDTATTQPVVHDDIEPTHAAESQPPAAPAPVDTVGQAAPPASHDTTSVSPTP